MANSVYSIVLNDAVVEAIDRLAYQNGTNRSSMINRILAERVSYTTPEQRIRNILGYVEKSLDSTELFQILMNTGDSSLNIKSPFKYKYNPSVKYQVVLNKGGSNKKGELRVTMRTQNSTLLEELDKFLNVWSAIEIKYLDGKMPCELSFTISKGKYVRELYLPTDQFDENTIGSLITAYIENFDSVMKFYFDTNDSTKAEKMYLKNLEKADYII